MQRALVSSQELPKDPFQWDKIPGHRPALIVNRSKPGFLSKSSLFFHDCFGRKGLGLSLSSGLSLSPLQEGEL